MTFTAPPPHLTRPDLQGTHAMAASTHWLATGTAQSVLERGGNAFDAGCAAAFVLHVVEPHLNGPGGDLVGLFATADRPAHPQVLMGQGPAPAGATIEHYRDVEGLDLVPGSGALAAAVPGAVDGWLLLLRDHGTWPVRDVLAPAVGYARDGHPVLPAVAAAIARVADLFTQHWPTSAARWMPDGHPPRPGDVITNPDYADLLDELCVVADDAAAAGRDRAAAVDAARDTWRARVGAAAEEFVATPHRHSDGRDHAGVLSAVDVLSFAASYEDPATTQFRGRTVVKPGAWTQGPVLLQSLRLLDGLDDDHLDVGTELGAHCVLETLKLALADREAWYGDADVPLEHLLSETYAVGRRALVGESASHELRPGVVPGRAAPPLPPLRADGPTSSSTGEPTVAADGAVRGDTCHLDVVDRWGNMLSATPSGGWLQSSPTVPDLGFCLGTRLQMTWLDEASPNRLEPGRRPRTTLSPTLVLAPTPDGGRTPVMACGTPGGDQQDQWQLPFLLRVLAGGWTPQQAVDAPTLHTTSRVDSFWPRTWTPGGAVVEDRLGPEVLAGLAERGHALTLAGDWALGRLTAVTRDPATGVLGAAANPRGAQGYAAGR
ncbi:gamma-glutamyltransferase family protein [Isoptericola aurantiacus]|uniref:gamma-glutamyltransferase family protein n=1 Tax=Isoptericola aurantiacus TaxID=3377839 RepID=UPI00383B754F